jgi:hypothetical protein
MLATTTAQQLLASAQLSSQLSPCTARGRRREGKEHSTHTPHSETGFFCAAELLCFAAALLLL